MNINVVSGYAHLAQRHLVRSVKATLRFKVELQGKNLLNHLVDTSDCSLRIDERAGWTRFNILDCPGMKNPFTNLQRLAETWMGETETRRSDTFPVDLMLPSDLQEHPDILEFALDNIFLTPASIYLGQVPRLTSLTLWWSPKNDHVRGSQMFHYDHRDTKQVKIFINLMEINENSGPLCFLPADVSSRFCSKIGYNQEKNEDAVIYSACSSDALVKNTGAPGTVTMVDTARCLHYGSRQNTNDRLILMISYVRPTCVRVKRKCSRTLDPLRDQLAWKLYANDPVRYYALTVKPR
jgi:hypothetical protein